MNLKHPELISLLILLPLALFFFVFVWRRRNDVLAQMGADIKLKELLPNASVAKTLTRFILLFVALFMIVISLISPRWGYEWKEVETKGTNIIVAFDVSASMMATDITPDRLTRAKIEISKLIDRFQGDRLGLIVFAGDSFLQTPLTHDYLMVKDWIAKISINSVSEQGTSIKSAIETARKAFKHIESEAKALVIISDGEEQDKETIEAAARAFGEGIKIFTIGIGTERGSPIKLEQGLVKDKDGNIVVSKLDDTLLKKVAEAAGGKYIRSTTGDFHLDQLYYEYIKANLKDEVLKSGKTKKWYETYQIFTAIAFVLLLIEFFLSFNLNFFSFFKNIFRSSKDNVFDISKSILLIYALSSLFAGAPVSANPLNWKLWQSDFALKAEKFKEAKAGYESILVQEPHNARLNYNLGIANYREGAYQTALADFARAAEEAKSKKLKEKAFYNFGNAHFKLEDYKSAIQAYESALTIDPNDEDAKHNLELARKMLEEQEKQQGKNKSEQDQDQKQNQNQDKKENPDQDKNNKEDNKDNNENNKDQKKQPGDNGQQPSQPNQQQNNDLSDDDVQRLLMQVEEADPGDVKQGMGQQKGSGANARKLNPW